MTSAEQTTSAQRNDLSMDGIGMNDSPSSMAPTRARSARRRWLVVGAAVLVPIVAVGWYWFQPQKLVLDDTIDEPLPAVLAAAPTSAPPVSTSSLPAGAAPVLSTPVLSTPVPTSVVATETTASASPATAVTLAGPGEVGRGDFRSLEHETTGTAVVFSVGDGTRLLRLEDLATSNGPDLRVILSAAPLSEDWRVWGQDYVELDRLKGNVGSQNYEIPADVDLGRYGRVVIWCDRFDVGFGVADIS